MAKGIIRKVEKARMEVEREISATASEGWGKISGALAGEGYNGGYRDALNDILLALNGVTPRRNGWWNDGT